MNVARYRELFDRELRGRLVPEHRELVNHPDLSDLDDAALDGFILRRRDRARRTLEWTVYGHDRPASLPDRLSVNGFQPESTETVMVGAAAEVAELADRPAGERAGVRLREVTEPADLQRIRTLQETVWGIDHGWLPDALSRALTGGDGDPCVIVVAEGPDGALCCASWIRFHPGTRFASLWGGSTVPQWRGRGLYRATVAHRAALAASRGFDLLRVDASADSAPILIRLGFVAISTISSYVWQPGGC